MDALRGKVALVTGASAGIGLHLVHTLLERGVKVVGCARRVENITAPRKELEGNLFAYKVSNIFGHSSLQLRPCLDCF